MQRFLIFEYSKQGTIIGTYPVPGKGGGAKLPGCAGGGGAVPPFKDMPLMALLRGAIGVV